HPRGGRARLGQGGGRLLAPQHETLGAASVQGPPPRDLAQNGHGRDLRGGCNPSQESPPVPSMHARLDRRPIANRGRRRAGCESSDPGVRKASMQTRRLGALEVSAIGLGCMGMSEFYGPSDETEAVATIHRALELGVTLLDTADMYGPFTNEELVGRAIRPRGARALVATKCGIVRDPATRGIRGVAGSPGYIRAACDASLRRLAVDHVDLYQLHRVDPKVPIEDSVGAMAELVRAGKTR